MMLLPLEVLPGWPTPEPFSMLSLILLAIVGPLTLAGILTLLAFAPKLRRQGERSTASTELATRSDS